MIWGNTVHVSQDILYTYVYISMYMVNVPHDMLKADVDIVNMFQMAW